MTTRKERDGFIGDVAKQSCAFLMACMESLCKLLEDPSPATRAAAAILLKDFVDGKFTPPPAELRERIADRLGQCVLTEQEPLVTHILIHEALAIAKTPTGNSVPSLTPSRN